MIELFKIISKMVNKLKILANKLLLPVLPSDWNHVSVLHQNESVRYNCLCLCSGKLCLDKETTDLLDWR